MEFHELSEIERLLLYNQYEILKKLSDDEHDKKEYEIYQKILQYGFVRNYQKFIGDIGTECTPIEVMNFVYEVFEMFRSLNYSYRDYEKNKSGTFDPEDLKFYGYDGNYEADHLIYADFLLNDLGLYKESQKTGKHASYNSHWPTIPKYKAMLRSWHQVLGEDSYRKLTLEEIKNVLEAKY